MSLAACDDSGAHRGI